MVRCKHCKRQKIRQDKRPVLFPSCKKLFSLWSAYWTNACASTAFNAFASVDFVFVCSCRDSAYWALSFASTAADAIAFNLVCHSENTSIVLIVPFSGQMYRQTFRLCITILTYHKKKSTNIPDLFQILVLLCIGNDNRWLWSCSFQNIIFGFSHNPRKTVNFQAFWALFHPWHPHNLLL